MALDKQQIDYFKRMLKEAQNKERFFAYIQQGADGDPILFLDKTMSLVKQAGIGAKFAALKKVMVMGTIKPISNHEWAFVATNPTTGKLPRSLKMFFGNDVPQLKKCQCLTPDEYKELTASTSSKAGTSGSSNTKAAATLKSIEKKISKATDQLKADASQLDDKALDDLNKRIAEYKKEGGTTDLAPALALIKKTKNLRKGAVAIEKKVSGFTDTRKDIVKRFKAVKGNNEAALKSQEVIIGEVKDYIKELKTLKARYEKLLAA